ncbi:type VI secretion system protein IglI family protein [Francisella philomiragia]|uniref:type VI secretion system protein IglI family protein n=1 Tax=Francisella philomiragia TaxID=28110 RepID=UPI0019069C71|nr:type VI secretion system protein IglI family protein [Francisella philomiragia]MBK2025804.1 phage tail protein [Francisella philomiragia]
MSKLISVLNNIELETQDRINLISNMQIHAKYENAEYDQFIERVVTNTNDTKSIDIYSLFLCLNSEICLTLDQINKIPDIIESYFSILESKFSNISPSDSKQKNELAEKGINKFLIIIDANLSEIKNLEIISSANTDNIIDLINKLIAFFDENSLSYDSDLKIQLSKTLNKLKNTLTLEEQKNQNEEQEPIQTIEEVKTNSKQAKPATMANTQGSEKWLSLVEKIEVLKSLVDSQRIFETSIVYDDIQNLLANFDPKEYFPEVFFPLYKKIAPIIGDIHKNIDYYSSSIQWSVAKKMYEIDYNQFLDNLERMPENNFLNNSSLAQDHFYETNSEAKKQYRENNKILEDRDAHKSNINIKTKIKKTTNNPQNIMDSEDDIENTNNDNISDDDLNKLFDF